MDGITFITIVCIENGVGGKHNCQRVHLSTFYAMFLYAFLFSMNLNFLDKIKLSGNILSESLIIGKFLILMYL